MDLALNLWNIGSKVVPYASCPPTSIEGINLEGLTSLIRFGMFPYAPPGTKIKLESHAINLEQPYKFGAVNTKSVTRYLNGEGRKDFAVVKEIAGIVLKILRPIPIEPGKKLEPITEIYLFAIEGLEFIKEEFFSSYSNLDKIPDPATFGSKFDAQKHPVITDTLAAESVMKTINLFKFCCKNSIEFEEKLTELQDKVKMGYTELLITQLANGLKLLKETQGATPISKEWLCQNEFESIDKLVQGRLFCYSKLLTTANSLLPKHSEKKQQVLKQPGQTVDLTGSNKQPDSVDLTGSNKQPGQTADLTGSNKQPGQTADLTGSNKQPDPKADLTGSNTNYQK